VIAKHPVGDCPICGAAHTACTAADRQTSIAVVQLPARDAAVAQVRVSVPLVAEQVQATLPAGSVTTGTYRGKKRP